MTNKHDLTPRLHFEESPVAPRSSFADREYLRADIMMTTGMTTRRVVLYPTPEHRKKQVRDSLIGRGLVLGQQFESQRGGEDSFMIPRSARPISHDAGSEAGGQFDYSDTNLFSDLGTLLGSVAKADSEQLLVLDNNVGRNIALVEFTKPGDLKLFLVPGFELSLKTAADNTHLLSLYGRRLYEEFGQRFDQHADSFLDSFNGVMSE